MDFITLASATGPRKLLRHLAGASAGAAGEAGEDDDFAHLAADASTAEAGADYTSGGLYGERPGTPYEQQFGGAVPDSSSPLLSPTAEAELFLLATNFLLCEYMTTKVLRNRKGFVLSLYAVRPAAANFQCRGDVQKIHNKRIY